ncbi:MAG: phrB [Holophagaceae bacterium]|nr:phrB [Holophagaceae bacterium]
MTPTAALVWFRRDLRARDHAALREALGRFGRVHGVFVFDRPILDALPEEDRRVEFIHGSVRELDRELARQSKGAGLLVRHGDARELIPRLALELGVQEVVCATDYEPKAIQRDAAVARALEAHNIAFTSLRDKVIFEKDELKTGAGGMYSVFTPYRKAWMRSLAPHRVSPFEVEGLERLAPKGAGERIPELAELGFRKTDLSLRVGSGGARELWDGFQTRIGNYQQDRDFPALEGTSRLSVHLRFGTISIRELVRFALTQDTEGAQSWLNELVWRDFYHQILWHRPDVESHAFKRAYEAVPWEEGAVADARFEAWCEGRTGYPLVDAAMRQLLSTGWMHNRLRMVTASFLTKDLGIHWLRGERFFARHLLDYDLAANNGGWQWAASTGCDAQPWFRIFNPTTQARTFDPKGEFIRRYQGDGDFPPPIVDHALARQDALRRFKGLA